MKVIFTYRAYSPASLAIRALTFSRWSHVAIMLSDSVVIDTTFTTGVRISSYQEFIKHYPINEIVDIAVANEDAAIDFAINQVGKPYDWTALLGIVVQRDWQDEDSWFCSELLEAILAAGGNKRIRDKISRVTPQISWAIA